MQLKTARLTLLIDPNKKAAFERLCALQDRTPSQVVRQLIRDYLAQHEIQYEEGASPSDDAPPSVQKPRPDPRPHPTRDAPSAPARRRKV